MSPEHRHEAEVLLCRVQADERWVKWYAWGCRFVALVCLAGLTYSAAALMEHGRSTLGALNLIGLCLNAAIFIGALRRGEGQLFRWRQMKDNLELMLKEPTDGTR